MDMCNVEKPFLRLQKLSSTAGEPLTYVHGPPTLLPYYLHVFYPPMGCIGEPLGAENKPKIKTCIFLGEKRVTNTFLEKKVK